MNQRSMRHDMSPEIATKSLSALKDRKQEIISELKEIVGKHIFWEYFFRPILRFCRPFIWVSGFELPRPLLTLSPILLTWPFLATHLPQSHSSPPSLASHPPYTFHTFFAWTVCEPKSPFTRIIFPMYSFSGVPNPKLL
jgi:hypothetical protein